MNRPESGEEYARPALICNAKLTRRSRWVVLRDGGSSNSCHFKAEMPLAAGGAPLMEKCPKCHSEHRVKADVSTEGHPLAGIKFRPEDAAVFSKRQNLKALACPHAGMSSSSSSPRTILPSLPAWGRGCLHERID